jgi:membrane protease YdiL (CAAX protease family)
MTLEPMSAGTNGPSIPGGRDPSGKHPMTRIFLGPSGIRVCWRLVFAIGLWLVISSGVLPILLILIPQVRAMLTHPMIPLVVTPSLLLLSEGITASAALLTALVMTRIEKRSFAEYGLPGAAAFGRRFWEGAAFGFVLISVLMGLIAALHGYSVSGVDLHGLAAARYAFLYLVGFISLAVFEEFSFRGYLQSTLQSAAGFWPAALILAAAFGAIHLGNPGESTPGVVFAGCFGLFAAFTLWRTGNIWFALGMHTFWDWGETYFYSVRDSGLSAAGHLLRSAFHGPAWLTGGPAGPEGSVIAFVVLALSAIVVHLLFPSRKRSA